MGISWIARCSSFCGSTDPSRYVNVLASRHIPLIAALSAQLCHQQGRAGEVGPVTSRLEGHGRMAPQGHAIRPYDANPMYWQYRGQPILLFGGSNRDNIFQWANNGTKLTDHLDLLKDCGGNYIRCTMSSREYTPAGYRWDLLPYPFAKVNGRYDLDQWDERYWRKLRTFLAETQKRGIIVQLELWDRWNESGHSDRRGSGWYDSPWNPNNNVNYDWADSPLLKQGNTGFYNAIYRAPMVEDPVLLPHQRRYVEKVIDEVLGAGHDHVLFQIDNESGIGDASLEPDPYWASFFRRYAESAHGRTVYVCASRRFHRPTPHPTVQFQDWGNPEIRVPIVHPAFNFCDISQNNGNAGQAHHDNLLWYRSKVLEHGPRPINHTKCYHFHWPTGADFGRERSAPSDDEAAAKFWRAVFGGAASVRFHRHTELRPRGLREGFGLETEAQAHIRSLRLLLDRIHVFTMAPANELLSDRQANEAYCLAQPPSQYAVFFTGEADRRIAIDLSPVQDDVSLAWLDVGKSAWHRERTLRGGALAHLTPPAGGLWAAVLKSP